jgi:hypothetical protein
MIFVAVLVMKLVSYAHVNHNLREEAATKTEKSEPGWPHNITASSKSALQSFIYTTKTFCFFWGFQRSATN